MGRPAKHRDRILFVCGVAVLTLVLVAAVALRLFFRVPDRKAPPSARSRVSKTAPHEREAHRLDVLLDAIRKKLGANPEAIRRLAGLLPEQDGAARDFLLRIRPELDLAVGSGDGAAATAAIRILSQSLLAGGKPIRDLLSDPTFRLLLNRGAASHFPETRRATVLLFGEIGDDFSRSRIVPLLSDRDPSVRIAAVRAYAPLAGRGGGSRLAAVFSREKDVGVRTAILRAFVTNPGLRGPGYQKTVRAALESGSRAERIQALTVIGFFSDRVFLKAVTPLLLDPHRDVRRKAIRVLMTLGDPRARAALVKARAKESDEKIKALLDKAIAALR